MAIDTRPPLYRQLQAITTPRDETNIDLFVHTKRIMRRVGAGAT